MVYDTDLSVRDPGYDSWCHRRYLHSCLVEQTMVGRWERKTKERVGVWSAFSRTSRRRAPEESRWVGEGGRVMFSWETNT